MFPVATALLLPAGCQPAAPGAPLPLTSQTGSSTIATSLDGGTVWAANPWDDVVVRLDRASGEVTRFYPGVEPSHVVPIGDGALVTLRGDSSLAVIREGELAEFVRVGAEPAGIVADSAASRVWVAISGEDRVVELDAETLDVRRTFDVEGQPTWLALHPGGEMLFVASALGGRLTAIEVSSGLCQTVDFPPMENDAGDPMPLRLTGDLSVDPGGTRIAVPLLYVDNNLPRSTGGWSSSSSELPRAGVGLVPLDAWGDVGPASAVLTVVPAHTDDFGRTQSQLGSYLSAVAFGEYGYVVAATMEGSDVVVFVEVTAVPEGTVTATTGAELDVDMATVRAGAAWVHAGPRGIVRDPAGAFLVNDILDRAIDAFDAEAVSDLMLASFEEDTTALRDELAVTVARFEPEAPDATIEAGRKLFFSATDPRMARAGSRLSCATCHFQGRNDGLTWPISDVANQTLSLAGGIGDTAPFTWTGTVPRVADEAMTTATTRLGGTGLEEDDALAIEAFVHGLRAPDPSTTTDPAAVDRGELLFGRFGCAACHTPPLYTDLATHDIDGLVLDTPSLRGIRLTPPYFHDGAAPTLRDAVVLAPIIGMGGPFSATPEELDDVVAFLESL